MASELKPVVDPRLTLIAEDAEGRPVGFALALPDFNQVLKHMNGRLFPFGVLKALWLRRKIDRLRVLTLGVGPEYRGKGLDALFYLGIFRGGNSQGILQGEFLLGARGQRLDTQAPGEDGCARVQTVPSL